MIEVHHVVGVGHAAVHAWGGLRLSNHLLEALAHPSVLLAVHVAVALVVSSARFSLLLRIFVHGSDHNRSSIQSQTHVRPGRQAYPRPPPGPKPRASPDPTHPSQGRPARSRSSAQPP